MKKVFEAMQAILESDQEIRIPGFGSFLLLKHEAKWMVVCGETKVVPARVAIRFRATPKLRAAVANKLLGKKP